MFESPLPGVELIAILSLTQDGSYYASQLATVVNNCLELGVADLTQWIYRLSEEIGYSDQESLTVALGEEIEGEGDDWEPDLREEEGDIWEPDSGDLLLSDAESLV